MDCAAMERRAARCIDFVVKKKTGVFNAVTVCYQVKRPSDKVTNAPTQTNAIFTKGF